MDAVGAYPHSHGFWFEALTMAPSARRQLQKFLELLVNRLTADVAPLMLEDRQDSFEPLHTPAIEDQG